MTHEASDQRRKTFLRPLASAAARLWANDAWFFAALTTFNVFLARRTFKSGIWADNDSVCHYVYLRHLLEEFWPATGTFIGFTPKFDLGAPFLLYNTPPGLYVLAALVAKATGASALASLKIVVVVAFLSVPILGARLARTFVDEAGDLPKFVALALALFSSELMGLEFYFKNGMLNPALGVPLLLSTLLFFRNAQRAAGHRALAWLALAGGAFAATAFVHLLTTYMLALALACCTLAAGPRRLGRSILQLGLVTGLGMGLVAFWLVPSAQFAAKTDAAFTWIRNPSDTIGHYIDGSLLSSYPVGFYPQFVTYSSVGIVAILCAAYGLWRALVLRNWPVLSFALTAAISLLVAMGPRPSFGLWVLPMYDRLLWYRFATLLELSTFVVAGWGAWQLHQMRGRLGVTVTQALIGGAAWAALVMTQRAVKVETVQDYPQFAEDVDVVSAWLRDHGKRGGRVYGEFLGQGVVDSAGVNYLRHMIPILSGYPEAGGWIYENDEAAQLLMKRGLFWYDPFPIITLGQRYDVQYVVAGSPNLVRVLETDPRWRRVVSTSHISLYEAVGREPTLLEARGWQTSVTSERYLSGGGYEYVLDARRVQSDAARVLIVKTGWSSAWAARVGDRAVTPRKTEDALVALDLPPAQDHVSVTMTWDISASRAKGNRISLVALVLAVLLVGAGARARFPRMAILERATTPVGLCAGVAALGLVLLRAHPLDEHVVGFGVRDGLDVTFDLKELEVGAFDDAEGFRPTRVLQSAWGARELVDGSPARALEKPDEVSAVVALSPAGGNRITVDAATPGAHIALALRDPASQALACRFEGAANEPITVPDACLTGSRGDKLGTTRELLLRADDTLVVHRIRVDSGIVFLEAEQMHNVLDDGGYEAFYGYGPLRQFSSNGVSMVARATLLEPIAIDRDVTLPEKDYDVWLLTRTVSPRLANGRAHFLLGSDERTFADVDPRTRQTIDFWDDDPRSEWIPGGRMSGGGTHRVRVTFYKQKMEFDALGELDALAFVPAAP
jgi:hypothetical protein